MLYQCEFYFFSNSFFQTGGHISLLLSFLIHRTGLGCINSILLTVGCFFFSLYFCFHLYSSLWYALESECLCVRHFCLFYASNKFYRLKAKSHTSIFVSNKMAILVVLVFRLHGVHIVFVVVYVHVLRKRSIYNFLRVLWLLVEPIELIRLTISLYYYHFSRPALCTLYSCGFHLDMHKNQSKSVMKCRPGTQNPDHLLFIIHFNKSLKCVPCVNTVHIVQSHIVYFKLKHTSIAFCF